MMQNIYFLLYQAGIYHIIYNIYDQSSIHHTRFLISLICLLFDLKHAWKWLFTAYQDTGFYQDTYLKPLPLDHDYSRLYSVILGD